MLTRGFPRLPDLPLKMSWDRSKVTTLFGDLFSVVES
jgi:hypothetical protein